MHLRSQEPKERNTFLLRSKLQIKSRFLGIFEAFSLGKEYLSSILFGDTMVPNIE